MRGATVPPRIRLLGLDPPRRTHTRMEDEVVGEYAREALFDMVEEAPEIGERGRLA